MTTLPESPKKEVNDPEIVNLIHELIRLCGGSPEIFDCEIITQMIQGSLKLLLDKHETAQLKLINRAFKEMRHAYRVFNKYTHGPCLSIFGSARTPENHPDYIAAVELSTGMAANGWMCITGAANGIMKAGLSGTQRDASFGLSIRLPFEVPTNAVIEGDPKLMMFRYFFTRKLMFLSHSDAVAAFPGGFGTLDELYEVLTLMQTGRSNIIPVVLCEGTGGTYWRDWHEYLQSHLSNNGWISPEDRHFYYLASSSEDAMNHILKFYRRYHSSRYVNELIVIRLLTPLRNEQIDYLNTKFKPLIKTGSMKMSPALPEETDFLDLPRLTFHHTRRDFGLLRALIDQINAFP